MLSITPSFSKSFAVETLNLHVAEYSPGGIYRGLTQRSDVILSRESEMVFQMHTRRFRNDIGNLNFVERTWDVRRAICLHLARGRNHFDFAPVFVVVVVTIERRQIRGRRAK